MLTLPEHHEPFRVLGMDPGSSTLGLTLLETDIGLPPYRVVYSETLKMTGREFPTAGEHHNLRLARHLELEDALLDRLRTFRPHVIASESPFMGRFAAAFRALSECTIIAQRTIYLYDPQLLFHYFSPIEVKRAVGIDMSNKKGRKKEDNQTAVHDHPLLDWHIDPLVLDEHMIDATAVAVTYMRGLTP